jgi:prepilin-type N-terminal cleavage/methylation domain-containing protein
MDGPLTNRRPAKRARILRVGAARPWRDESGVTLIEVVIAAVLLGILASAVLTILLKTQSATVVNRGRVAAANLAAREIELVKDEFARKPTAPVDIADAGVVTNPHPLTGGVAGQPLVLDGTPYTVVRSAQWNVTGNTGKTACEGGVLVAQPTLGITVSVTWPHMGTVQPVVSSAIMAPVKGTGVPTTSSFVAVSVTDSLGAANPGRAVRVESGAEVYHGLTDESGCAVIEVNPATTGTQYTASLGDAGYVDVSGNMNPSKMTGSVGRGVLSGPFPFTYDRAGQVRLTLVDPSGGPLTKAQVAGAQVTLVASLSSGGATSGMPYTLSDVVTTITGLWPTQYGAYFGLTAPLSGYASLPLAPGGSIDLAVPFAKATMAISGMPAGTTLVIAVPSAAGTTCTTSGAVTVSPAAVSLMPGTWDFFAVGSTFACSPGPNAQALDPGVNDDIAWGTTTFRVNNVPAGNALWAVEQGKAGGALATCPTAGQAATAQNIDAARTGPVVIPAGNWYLYLTNGPAAGGTCVRFPATINPTAVAYGVANVQTWPAPTPVTLNVSSVPSYGSGQYATIMASSTTGPGVSCTATVFTNGGTQVSLGTGSTVSGSLAQGTWYIYSWDKRNFGAGNPRCKLGGTVIAGSNSPLNLTFNSTSPGTVGP